MTIDGRRHVPQTKMRAAIARRMSQSKRDAPHFYVRTNVALGEALTHLTRANVDRSGEERITVTAVLVRAVTDGLIAHPHLNAHWVDECLTVIDTVNVGVAVAVEDGLLAPALLDCGSLAIPTISTRLRDLAARARAGKLRVPEMNEPTFTLSNLGTYGVTDFTAILNPPQVAILATGRAEQRPVVEDGSIVARTTMTMTLSADHRAVDGAAAAGFIESVRRNLEAPSGLRWEDDT